MPRYSFFLTSIFTIVICLWFLITGKPILYLHLTLLYAYSFFVIISINRIPKSYLNLALIILFVSLSEMTSYITSMLFKTNHPVYHFTVPLLILGYGLFFRSNLNLRNRKGLFDLLIFGLIIASFLNSLFIQETTVAPSYAFIILSFFVVTCSLIQLKNMIHQPVSQRLSRQAIFWFSIGSLIFYSVNFASFGLHAVISSDLPNIVYNLVMWLNILLYFVYFISIYLSTQHFKSK